MQLCTFNIGSCLEKNQNKTSYELWFGRKAIVKNFKVFGSKYYIKKTKNNIGKFEDKEYEGIFLRYSSKSKAYQCYNKRLEK